MNKTRTHSRGAALGDIEVKVEFDGIERIREELHLSKGEFAHKIGISPTAYSSMIRNPTQIKMETLGKILSAVNNLGRKASLEDLFTIIQTGNP